jgi:hypothetical protein
MTDNQIFAFLVMPFLSVLSTCVVFSGVRRKETSPSVTLGPVQQLKPTALVRKSKRGHRFERS